MLERLGAKLELNHSVMFNAISCCYGINQGWKTKDISWVFNLGMEECLMTGMRETDFDSLWWLVKRMVFSQLASRQERLSSMWGNWRWCDRVLHSRNQVALSCFSPSMRLSLIRPIYRVAGVMIGLEVFTHLLCLQRRWSRQTAMSISKLREAWSSLHANLIRILALRPWQNAAFRPGSFQPLPAASFWNSSA